MCSTPCGVTRIFTMSTIRSFRSAIVLCSTPRSVIEIFTRLRAHPSAHDRTVLNASRRLENLHDVGVEGRRTRGRGCSTPRGVSEIIAPRSGREGSSARSYAQRLAASQESSLRGIIFALLSVFKCSTLCGVIGISTLWIGIIGRMDKLCSTPIGVTEIFTRGQAFEITARGGCSTPYGIWNLHSARQSGRRPCARAQRLVASQESSPEPASRINEPAQMCSTPYGVSGISTEVDRQKWTPCV